MTDITSKVRDLLALGHSLKAQKVFMKHVADSPSDVLKQSETELRQTAEMFFPRYKKRSKDCQVFLDQWLRAPQSKHILESLKVQVPVPPVAPRTPTVGLATNPPSNRTKEDEFQDLVSEMCSRGFTHSRQVSLYIVTNNLRTKYPRLAGRIIMDNGVEEWPFDGGIDPRYYARLCDELGLSNRGSTAVPKSFTPFADM